MTDRQDQLQHNPETMFAWPPYREKDIDELSVIDQDQYKEYHVQACVPDFETQEQEPKPLIPSQREVAPTEPSTELEIFKILNAKRNAVVAELAETGQLDVITRERNRIINDALGKDKDFCELRNRIVLNYTFIAEGLAWERAGMSGRKNVPVADVGAENYGVAMTALIEAANTYKPLEDKGAKFSSYAYDIIRWSIMHSERARRGNVRAVDESWPAYKKALDALVQQGKPDPTNKEIAEVSGLDEELVKRIISTPRTGKTISLEQCVADENGRMTNEGLLGVEDTTEASDNFLELNRAFKSGVLDDREKKVIAMSYWHEMGQKEIGAELGVSQMHVSRVHRDALEKLRKKMGIQQLPTRPKNNKKPVQEPEIELERE